MAELVELPPFPTDDVTLAAVSHALGGSLTFEGASEDGPRLVGADYSLSKLLEFLSGYDESLCRPLLNEYDQPVADWVEYPGPIDHVHDVIAALIAEVLRLRSEEV